jgi:16S rRNA (guanine527-N7)-methyltransferase
MKSMHNILRALAPNTDPERFEAYVALLCKWNNTYNLTAIRDPMRMLTHHIFDSLAILPWITGTRVLDVGAGAGLPGIPLALASPEKNIVLLDSNGKKTRFLHEVKRILNLPNIEIIHQRVESYHPSAPFDTVTSRAFSDVSSFINGSQHLLSPTGFWVAMKGHQPDTELRDIAYSFRVESYTVPEINESRCVVIIQRQ